MGKLWVSVGPKGGRGARATRSGGGGEKKASERASERERDDCGEIHQMGDEIDDTTTDLARSLSPLFSRVLLLAWFEGIERPIISIWARLALLQFVLPADVLTYGLLTDDRELTAQHGVPSTPQPRTEELDERSTSGPADKHLLQAHIRAVLLASAERGQSGRSYF